MPAIPNLSEIRRSLGGMVRADVKKAAGADGLVDDTEAQTLRPFLKDAVADLGGGSHKVDDVVDAAMARASAGWGAVNQTSGPGKNLLSAAELLALSQRDPDLSAATAAAAQIAFAKKNPVDIHLDNAPPGVTLEKTGAHKVKINADASVAVGAQFSLVIDGNAQPLARGPAGITVDTLVAPPGYGLEVLGRTVMTEPMQSATVQITRDERSWLKPAQLLSKARHAVTEYVRHVRLHDADWGQYYPTTWAGLVQKGVPAQIDAMFTSTDTQIIRKKDSVLYVGRGPFDLYTEVEIKKGDGAVDHVLVEID